MGGIAGVIRLDGGQVGEHALDAMAAALATRGPDRQARTCQGEAGFAHALLATTPEALSERQPWRHPASGCIVVSDSRLDHRARLLRTLGIDRPADEVGDAELLHAAWQRWKEDCVDRLRGDFAFAIWDPARRELFMARDPMGVRPLALHIRPGRLLVFGSVPDVVLAQGEVPRTLDDGRIADALIGETEGIDQTCTFHAAVERLPPAHWLRWRDGRFTRQRYWQPVGDERPRGLPGNEAEWIEAQREQLDRAVRLRLRSHRPVGSMLSGGLDSSSVVALASLAAAERGAAPFPVFSAINSADAQCLETRHIRAVIARAACTATLVDLPEFARSATAEDAWWHRDADPFDSGMTLVAALYAAAARQGVPSLLDGLPADNLYVLGDHARRLLRQGRWKEGWRYAVSERVAGYARFPRLHALRMAAGALLPAPVHAARAWWTALRDYRRLVAGGMVEPAFARSVALRRRYRRYVATIGGSHQWHDSGDALSTMAAPYITAGIERYNRVATAFGVEPRHPFADRDLIEFQAWMPLALRNRAGHAKWVLRQAMAGALPHAVAWRRDKLHLGWRFSQAQARAGCEGQAALFASTGPYPWLDARRAAAETAGLPAEAVAGRLFQPMAVARWLRAGH